MFSIFAVPTMTAATAKIAPIPNQNIGKRANVPKITAPNPKELNKKIVLTIHLRGGYLSYLPMFSIFAVPTMTAATAKIAPIPNQNIGKRANVPKIRAPNPKELIKKIVLTIHLRGGYLSYLPILSIFSVKTIENATTKIAPTPR